MNRGRNSLLYNLLQKQVTMAPYHVKPRCLSTVEQHALTNNHLVIPTLKR